MTQFAKVFVERVGGKLLAHSGRQDHDLSLPLSPEYAPDVTPAERAAFQLGVEWAHVRAARHYRARP